MTGGMEGICNEIGYLKLEDRTIICIGFLKSIKEIEWNKLEEIMTEIGEIILDHYIKN